MLHRSRQAFNYLGHRISNAIVGRPVRRYNPQRRRMLVREWVNHGNSGTITISFSGPELVVALMLMLMTTVVITNNVINVLLVVLIWKNNN